MFDLILFPFGGNAKEAIAVVNAINKEDRKFNIIGFIDDNKDLWHQKFAETFILGGKEILHKYKEAKIIAVPGRPDTYVKRRTIIDSLKIDENRYTTLIHPNVQIGPKVSIGYNTLIMAGVVITSNVVIGNHCIILPNTVISHDAIIGDYCMIGSNVSISGSVVINENCYIGTGCKIIQEIEIGAFSLIGIGSVVINSVKKNSVIVGNPGRFLKEIE